MSTTYVTVSSGQTELGQTVASGTDLIVLSGGFVSGIVVQGGGELDLFGGTAGATSIGSGGEQFVSGGHAFATVVSGGTEKVEGGGTASASVVESGGGQIVSAGGIATATTVDAESQQSVNSGASALGTVLHSGAAEFVFPGGSVSGLTVASGAALIVAPGGSAAGTTVDPGGAVYSTGVLVLAPGISVTSYSGVVSGALPVGDQEAVLPGGTAVSTVVSAGSRETVFSGGTEEGATVLSGAWEAVSAGGLAHGLVLAGGSAEIVSGAVVSDLVLAGSGDVLMLDGSATAGLPGTPVSGFVAGDIIDLSAVAYDAAGSVTLQAGNTLAVAENGITLDIPLDPARNYAGASFALAPETTDYSIGPLLPFNAATAITTTAAPCFRAGTRIATPCGALPVEALRAGMEVVLADGGTGRVVWTGWRQVDCQRHKRPWDVWPVCVRAHAFAPGQPRADLWLSPDHAVFVQGVLIPIRRLCNGASIAQAACDSVAYHHVELARHGVLLAEGLPCESYLDTGNRGAFANGSGALDLHPEFARRVWDAAGCATLVLDGSVRAAVHVRLLARAQALGHRITTDPALRLTVDGRRVALCGAGRRWRAALPDDARVLRLLSRDGVPAWFDPASDDHRRLGVAVVRIALDSVPVALDDPRLGAGWHGVEAGWRWTDGTAVVLAGGARRLAVDLAITGRTWLPRPQQGRRRYAGQ